MKKIKYNVYFEEEQENIMKKGQQERSSQDHWDRSSRLHKNPVPQMSDGVGKRLKSTPNDKKK